jgi:hypothetical protein
MRLVGAGLSRTGTGSLQAALHMLFPEERCYHTISDIIAQPYSKSFVNDVFQWNDYFRAALAARKAGQTPPVMDFDKFFLQRGYTSGVDMPFATLWRDILKAYPDCKIVLSVRDTPEEWARSWREMLVQRAEAHADAGGCVDRCLKRMNPKNAALRELWELTSEYNRWPKVTATQDTAVLTRIYTDWMNDVKTNAPQDRLLIWNVKEGWKPLCKFLGVPVPSEAFPRVHEVATMKTTLQVVHKKAARESARYHCQSLCSTLLPLLIILFVILYLYTMWFGS